MNMSLTGNISCGFYPKYSVIFLSSQMWYIAATEVINTAP